MKIVTFNMAFATNGEYNGINNFRHRLGLIIDRLIEEKPDILCVQELQPYMYSMFRPVMKGLGYSMIYNQREVDMGGEGLAVCLKDETAEFHTLDRYWFSETPDIPGTRYPGQTEFTRIGQDALIRYLPTGEFIRVFNNHFECRNEDACRRSMEYVLQRLCREEEYVHTRFFIVGDLNSVPESPAIQYARRFDRIPLYDVTESLPYTSHGFDPVPIITKKIDYIFTDRKSSEECREVTCWENHANDIWLSDHYPVQAVFNF